MIQSDSRYSSGLYGSIIHNHLKYPQNTEGDKEDDKEFMGH